MLELADFENEWKRDPALRAEFPSGKILASYVQAASRGFIKTFGAGDPMPESLKALIDRARTNGVHLDD